MSCVERTLVSRSNCYTIWTIDSPFNVSLYIYIQYTDHGLNFRSSWMVMKIVWRWCGAVTFWTQSVTRREALSVKGRRLDIVSWYGILGVMLNLHTFFKSIFSFCRNACTICQLHICRIGLYYIIMSVFNFLNAEENKENYVPLS